MFPAGEKKEATMRKIKTKHDMDIPGWGFIPAGTPYMVERYNKRFVYIRMNSGCIMRLARKADCEVIY